MGSQLNGYIRVLLEQRCELVESLGAGRCKGGFVEIVEDVVDKDRGSDRCQGELQHIFLALFGGVDTQFFLVIEESLARCHQQIVHMRLNG